MHVNLLTLTRLLINSELLYFLPIYIVNLFKQKPLKCSINSCQLCTAQVSFSVGIFRCKNAVFHQRGERVFKFSQERVRNAFGTRSERVWNAFGTHLERVWNAFGTRSGRVPNPFRTQMERERTVRLFLSSTVLYQMSIFPKYLLQNF